MTKILSFLFLALMSSQVFAVANISQELECHRAIQHLSNPRTPAANSIRPQSFELQDNSVVVPADRNGRRSFYVFTENEIHHYWAPRIPYRSVPVIGNPDATSTKYFEVTFQIPGRPAAQFEYEQVDTPEGARYILSRENSKSPAQSIPLQGGDLLNDETREVLRSLLRNRVANTFHQFTEYVPESVNPADVHETMDAQYQIENYKNALKICENVSGLREAVQQELEKFALRELRFSKSQTQDAGTRAREANRR